MKDLLNMLYCIHINTSHIILDCFVSFGSTRNDAIDELIRGRKGRLRLPFLPYPNISSSHCEGGTTEAICYYVIKPNQKLGIACQ